MPAASTHYRRRHLSLTACLALAGCLQPLTAADSEEIDAPAEPAPSYEVFFTARFEKGSEIADTSIRIGEGSRRFRELSFNVDPERFSDFDADGNLVLDDGRLTWRPPREGGTLSYEVVVTHRRRNGGFDARITDDWALFRGDDLFPPAATSVTRQAASVSKLRFELPSGWSAITPYLSGDGDLEFDVVNDDRLFDRPAGWMLVGKIGVRRGKIAERRVAIAAPTGEDFRRMDVMAFLNWTLPSLTRVFPTMGERLVIVGAGDPMWRGGLSGPGSLFVHADRPLISENGTSTFLHELVHVAMGTAGSEHDDWLLEGFAEYYSIRILNVTGTLSVRRMELALEMLEEWGSDVDNLFVRSAKGPVMARATTLLAALDATLLENAPDGRGLDAVVAAMIDNGAVFNYEALCVAAKAVMDRPVPMLSPSRVPGAPDVEACGP